MFGVIGHGGSVGARRLAVILGLMLWAAAAVLVPAHARASGSLVVAPVAGTGTPGTAVPGPAVSSPLRGPAGVAVDAAGDVLVADPAENRVLEVNPAGTLSVLAGTGTAGAPVTGPALASPLNAPAGVAVDGSGDVYIADTGNAEVEKVTPAGMLSVIAGTGASGAPVAGPALTSPLSGPTGVAVDGSGNLYIADGGGAAPRPYVERVTAATGALSILAGSGTTGQPVNGPATSSALRTPLGVAVDTAGNVYIADAAANVIEKVTPGGTLSVFAGRSGGWSGPPSNGAATSSRLSHPRGVAVDANNNVEIADTANNRVEQVSPGGSLTILGGNGTTGRPAYGAAALSSALWGPQAIAVAPDGVLDLADGPDATVDRLQPPPPAATAAPMLTGTARQGQTLTASTGEWSGTVTAESYAWEDCSSSGSSCTVVAGATGNTYTLGARDIAHTVRVIAGVSGPFGGASSTSGQSAVVLPLPPSVVSTPQVLGTPTDREMLTISPGSWSGSPTSLSYQWQSCDASGGSCSDVDGATTPTYTLGQGDVGTTLRVTVIAVNAGGTSTVHSPVSAVIAPATEPWANVTPPAVVAAPMISGYGGGAVVGDTLSCSTGQWSDSPSGFSFGWSRDAQPISGATQSTYTITKADRGYRVSCSVIAMNTGGAIQADSFGVAVAGQRAAVPATPKPPRGHGPVTATAPARTARLNRAGHRTHRTHHTHGTYGTHHTHHTHRARRTAASRRRRTKRR